MLRKRKKFRNMWDENRKITQQAKQIIQPKEINQNVLAKEGRLKRYRDRVKQCRQNRAFQNNERKLYHQ